LNDVTSKFSADEYRHVLKKMCWFIIDWLDIWSVNKHTKIEHNVYFILLLTMKW